MTNPTQISEYRQGLVVAHHTLHEAVHGVEADLDYGELSDTELEEAIVALAEKATVPA